MSKSASTATLFPAWKQEVNRRVAAHLSRKAPFAGESTPAQDDRPTHRTRAAQAAARVAQRYAQAPSYSELLADEARNAMRAAEAASKAAQQAQAAVQYVLDGLEAAAMPEMHQQTEIAPHAPESPTVLTPTLAGHGSMKDWQPTTSGSAADEIAEPIYPNLIQFPRPMIATRRVRPRRAEGPLAIVEAEPQLSIFEVDPASVSTLPPPTMEEPAAPVWMRAEESGVEFQRRPEPEVIQEPAPQMRQHSIKVAPLNFRLMALIVDSSLSVAAFLALAKLAISGAGRLPGLHAAELAAVVGIVLVCAVYQELFLVLAGATPGMRYAGIALMTLEGKTPSRAERSKRLSALALSIAPLGLGLLWALFDENGLTGHDRLSKTYLRMR